MSIVETRYTVPGWGIGELWRSGNVVLAHDFRFGAAAGSVEPCDTVSQGIQDGLVERFCAFLAGDEACFDGVELDFAWATPLQRELARALRSVPRGEVVSYGELAALAGRPRAARAAGAFCAANRFAFVVPCHRVVAASGIGGYGDAGVAVKRRLLALEGVVL